MPAGRGRKPFLCIRAGAGGEIMGGTGIAEAGMEAAAGGGFSFTVEGGALAAAHDVKMLSQEKALKAHALLWESFPKDEQGWPSSYPEDYAGCYIDDSSNLVILLVNPTKESKEAYRQLCGGSEKVMFQAAQYTMSELESYNETARKLAEEYELVSWGVNEKNNSYIIRVKTEDYGELSSQLNRTRSASPVILEATDTSIEMTASYIYGGQKCVSSTGSSTIGVGGTYNGKDAVLMAGHAVARDNLNIYNSANVKIGTVVKRQFDHWEAGDYAIVQLASGYASNNKLWPTGASIISVSGANPNLPVGTAIRKYGIATGYSYGTIENMVVEMRDDTTGITVRSMCSALMTNSSSTVPAVWYGDSGGPVCRVTSDGKFMIAGTLAGRDRELVEGKCRMYYNDISFPTGAGFKLKTS